MNAKAKASALTPRQACFVQEYLVDLNATQAAIRAGYSRRGATAQGSRLLANAKVAAKLSTAQAKRAERVEISADMVLRELALIGFANMGDYMRATTGGDPYLDFADLSREQTAVLSEVTIEDFTDGRGDDAREVKRVKFKLCDKRAALVDIGKHLGMFVDRIGDPDGKPLAPPTVTVQLIRPDEG